MKDDAKTKKQLLEELDALRKRIAEVEESQRERLQPQFGGESNFFAAATDTNARKEPEHQLEVLHELIRVAVSSLDIGEVFDGVGEQVMQLIDFDQFSVYFHKFGDDYAQGHSITSDSLGPLIRLPLNQSSTGDCIKTAQPILRRYFPDESPYAVEHQYSKDWGFRSAMYLPLASRGHVFGVLIFGSLEWGKYTEDELELAREIADQLALVFEHALLYEESRETAKNQERNRLAREIHDTIAQELTRIMWQLNATERAVASGVKHGLEALEDVRNLVRGCLQQVRRSVWDLQSPELESRSLSDAIRREVLRLGEQGIQASMQDEGQEPESMDRECQLAVLRIAQEALNNTRRHSHAETVTISLMFGATSVKLQVFDDGTGFDLSLKNSKLSPKGDGFGMISMRERARLAGGRFEVQSTPGIGTRVEVEIPYQPQRKEAPTPTMPSSGTS